MTRRARKKLEDEEAERLRKGGDDEVLNRLLASGILDFLLANMISVYLCISLPVCTRFTVLHLDSVNQTTFL